MLWLFRFITVVEETLVYPMVASIMPGGDDVTKKDTEDHHRLEEASLNLNTLCRLQACTNKLQSALECR